MLQKVVSLILISSILASAANFIVPLGSYYANYHYFSTVACIHKYNPEMHCNGSCQLKRMLQKEQKDSAKNSEANVNHSIRKDFYFSDIHSFLIHPLSDNRIQQPLDEIVSNQFSKSPPSPPPQLA